MYASTRFVAILLFAASTVAPVLSTSLGSGVVSRDESLGIRNNLRLRQEALDKECQDKYRDSDGSCFYTDVDNSGGSYGSCICWYDDYLDEGSDWCGENLQNDACYYDSYLITLGPNEVSQGGCACPPPGNDA